MSSQVQVVGEQLSLRDEFAIANWAGSIHETRHETYVEATEAMEQMLEEAKKQGFSASAGQLKILRREIREIAGAWIG